MCVWGFDGAPVICSSNMNLIMKTVYVYYRNLESVGKVLIENYYRLYIRNIYDIIYIF